MTLNIKIFEEQIHSQERYVKALMQDSVEKCDVIIFQDPLIAYFLRAVEKPKVLYNHTCLREVTFTYKFSNKYRPPLEHMFMETIKPRVLEIALEGYNSAQVLLTNSQFTKRMLKKHYGVDAEVVYPPVDRQKFKPGGNEKGNYFLSVQRVDGVNKRVEIQLEIFKEIPNEELIIAGPGRSGRLDVIAEKIPNITYLGTVSDKKLIELYRGAKGTIQTGFLEDFGLVPIESIACGTPVIVVDEGGFKETVNTSVGVRVKPPYVKNFRSVITSFDTDNYNPLKLHKYTKKFAMKTYSRTMKEKVDEAIRKFNSTSDKGLTKSK